jgi:hypothetical protein
MAAKIKATESMDRPRRGCSSVWGQRIALPLAHLALNHPETMRLCIRPAYGKQRYFVGLSIGAIIAGAFLGIFAISSANANTWLGRLMKDGFASGVVATLFVEIAWALWVIRGDPFWIYLRPSRNPQPLDSDSLVEAFTAHGEWKMLKHGYREALGLGKKSASILELVERPNGPFHMEMLIRPMPDKRNHWRAGIALVDPQNPTRELGLAHVDNHRVLVGYTGGKLRTRVCQGAAFEDRWSTFGIQVSWHPDIGKCMFYARADDCLYQVGEVERPADGWRVEIRVWSDDVKTHRVVVGRIFVNQAQT